VIAARLAERLETNLGLSHAFAAWAVETWSSCLGVGGGTAASVSRDHYNCNLQATGSSSSSSRFQSGGQSSRPALETVTVSILGRGHYSRISAALAAAGPGTRILVEPGLYRESLVIDKPVEIIGDGNRTDIVVSSDSGPCLRMKADYALVQGISFRGTGRRGAEGIPAVDIGCGKLTMEDCEIVCSSSDCIVIHGNGTDPVIRRCVIHDGRRSGVRVTDSGRGTIEECDIWGNEYPGVAISQSGHPIISKCRIHDGKASGVLIHGNGCGTIEECDIWANALSGIAVTTGGNPSVRNCRVHDGKEVGVRAYSGGRGTFVCCETWGNAMRGVQVEPGGEPVFIGCTYRDKKQEQ